MPRPRSAAPRPRPRRAPSAKKRPAAWPRNSVRREEDARRAEEEQRAGRRARDLGIKLAEAEGRLAAGDFAKARKSTDAAAQIDAQAPAVQAMRARIAEAEARIAQEKAEQQKAAEAARQVRERDQKVGALITRARKAKRPPDALGFLEEAQRLDPQRPELAALIAQRQAEIARAAAPPPERPAERVAEPGVPERKAGRPLSPAILGGAAAAVLLLVAGLWYSFASRRRRRIRIRTGRRSPTRDRPPTRRRSSCRRRSSSTPSRGPASR